MKARSRMHASFVQTLVYYDGPVLALLQNRKGSPVLALALPENVEGYAEPFIAKATSDRLLDAYLAQKVDLHYIMTERRGGDPYMFDWASFDKEVTLVPAETVVEDVDALLPEQGYFARNHTEPFLGSKVSVLVSRSYRIDGRWSAKDFSRFYAKLDDLYSLFAYLQEVREASGALSTKLAETITSYPFQRGGSYLAFFRDIAHDAKDDYPLQVSKIKYASPGEIEVKGVEEPLSEIDALVRVFEGNRDGLAEVHRELKKILEGDGVLGTDDTEFSNGATTKMANTRAAKLLEGMGIEDAGAIKAATNKHAVLFAKIALAVYRRGEELSRFHTEGRMTLPT